MGIGDYSGRITDKYPSRGEAVRFESMPEIAARDTTEWTLRNRMIASYFTKAHNIIAKVLGSTSSEECDGIKAHQSKRK